MNPQLVGSEMFGPVWIKVYPDEEMADTCDLTLEELGLYNRLRWYALHKGGFTENIDELWPKLRNFVRIHRQKFDRLWPHVREKFKLCSGFYTVERDEERISQSRLKLAKSREDGRLAAEKRWGATRIQAINDDSVTMGDPSSDPMLTDQTDYIDKREVPPPPPNPRSPEVVVVVDSPLAENKRDSVEHTGLTEPEYQQFLEHAQTVQNSTRRGVSAPSRKLCQKIREKFPELGVPQILERLVLFEGQTSAGLWDTLSREQLEAEARKRTRDLLDVFRPAATPKKPSYAEQQEAKAREFLRRQASG
jgi:hypothetical protein